MWPRWASSFATATGNSQSRRQWRSAVCRSAIFRGDVQVTRSPSEKNSAGEQKHSKRTASPTVFAQVYIDDAAFGCPTRENPNGGRRFVDWDIVGPRVLEMIERTRGAG